LTGQFPNDGQNRKAPNYVLLADHSARNREIHTRAVQAELKTSGDPKDANILKMLRLIDEQLNPWKA